MTDLPLHGIAVYNPDLWSKEELKRYFIARSGLLARIIEDLRRERPGSPPQHRLILGHRGMGKTTLLRRIGYAVEDDAELNRQWLPLTFPEEQYNIVHPADLWLNSLDAISDYMERTGNTAEADAIDTLVAAIPRTDAKQAQQALLDTAKRLDKRLLLLIDNIDLVLDRLRDKQWELRETLQSEPTLMIIGASSRAVEASYKYDAAFYDFFRIDELKGLSEEEMRATLLHLAKLNNAEQVIRIIDNDPARIKTLHTLTGGNPRTAVMLYGVLSQGFEGDVRSDLEGLLDKVTPLYKARFEELPEQAQQVVDALAIHWYPASANLLAGKLAWEVNTVSAQLNRLTNLGVVEKVQVYGSKRAAFQISERFFNIWYLMRASRRLRRKLVWLIHFCHLLFAAEKKMTATIETNAINETNTPYPQMMNSNLQRWSPDSVGAIITAFKARLAEKQGRELLAELDGNEMQQQWLPLREAVAAAAEGTSEYLNNVAPEIRQPALGILKIIAPEIE